MMLFNLAFRNIKRSLRDYAIYFFTLIIGVSVFYVFNAIGTQAAYMQVSERRSDIVAMLTQMLSGISIFVSAILGLLIVYASRFLMKRRNKEFALYLTLGMSKGNISAIMLIETIFIGVMSLAAGLIFGMGLSQLMSALVANLFEADMTAYKFTISGAAIIKTILCFAVIYLVVMIFNSFMVSKFQLIELIHSDKKSEKIKLKNPMLCVLIFLISAFALGFAYYQVGWNYNDLNQAKLGGCIVTGAVSTFLIFWSVSGLLLRILMTMKQIYYKNINSFTFRQLSSKVNTMVFSMTLICLMLFVTICSLSAAFSIRNSMNANLKLLCPADCEITYWESKDEQAQDKQVQDEQDINILSLFQNYEYKLTDKFKDYVHFKSYADPEFTFGNFFGDYFDEVTRQFRFLNYKSPEDVVRLSDYNELMKLYKKEPLSLKEDECIVLCDFKSMKNLRDEILGKITHFTIMGHTLKSKYKECQDGFIDISSQPLNAGLFIVPDSVVDEAYAHQDYFIGNYVANTKDGKHKVDDELHAVYKKINHNDIVLSINTKSDISEATIGLGAIVTFLGLYIGLVFLISCGAILALKELSESVDSIGRYTMLRKIGVEEADISKSLRRQTGLFFLLPLVLAGIHSVFGMKFASYFLEIFGTEKIGISVLLTVSIILVIYGGYFMITYFCSKGIIREK